MVTLFDIVRQAQGGGAIDNLARQFGLSGDQARRAVEAFLPAFSMGMQRSASNPFAFAQLLEMMSSGRFAPFYDGAGLVGVRGADGQQVLDRLFGSPEVSRQVAAQASVMTGIGTQVLQQMLPAVAGVIMGGLFRGITVEGLADFLRGWSDWLRTLKPPGAASSRDAGPASPVEAWTNLMAAFMGGASAPARPPPPADPWSGFMAALAVPGTARPPSPPPSQPDPFATLSRMFETGREVQTQHLANIQAIFEGLGTATAIR